MKVPEDKERYIFKNSYSIARQKLNIHKYNIVRSLRKGNIFLHILDHVKKDVNIKRHIEIFYL